MADQPKWVPEPPAGLHGPSADAPGSLLDRGLRREVRELLAPVLLKLVPAVLQTFRYLAGEIAKGNFPHPPNLGGAMTQMPGQGADAPQPAAASLPAPPTPATPGGRPFPHGDLDLSFITANVATPNAPRTGQNRQFYFLKKPNVPGGG